MSPKLPAGRHDHAPSHHTPYPPSTRLPPVRYRKLPKPRMLVLSLRMLRWSLVVSRSFVFILFDSVRSAVGDGVFVTLTTVP